MAVSVIKCVNGLPVVHSFMQFKMLLCTKMMVDIGVLVENVQASLLQRFTNGFH
jgi:hypothetical protein